MNDNQKKQQLIADFVKQLFVLVKEGQISAKAAADIIDELSLKINNDDLSVHFEKQIRDIKTKYNLDSKLFQFAVNS